jgi:hypothetical protein
MERSPHRYTGFAVDRIQAMTPMFDDVNRCRLIIDLVQDPDIARMQPVDACGAPRDRIEVIEGYPAAAAGLVRQVRRQRGAIF